jgi:thioester reductase-like protein
MGAMATQPSRSPRDGAVLLTGATGFIGIELLARFVERDERPVYALVRGRDDAEAQRRVGESLRAFFGEPNGRAGRVKAIAADIERPGLGLDPARREALAGEVTDVIHSAASVSFTLPLPQSREVNVEGTRRMLEFAELCERRGRLDRFSYVSTAYVAGTHTGTFEERDLDVGQGFRNPYEQSKFEAERLVRSRDGRLPIQVFRPSIVVGEQSTGWTASFNVLYTPLKAFVRGALPAMPARRSAPVDVVPVDYVADAVYHLSHAPVDGSETYNLVAGPRATSVGRLIALSAAHLHRKEPVTITPMLFRKLIYPVLRRRGSRRLRQGLARTEVFFPYFEMDVSYGNDVARSRLEPAGISVPPIESYFERLVGYASRASWGRSPLSRAQVAAGERQ